jgi:hypothetical protein
LFVAISIVSMSTGNWTETTDCGILSSKFNRVMSSQGRIVHVRAFILVSLLITSLSLWFQSEVSFNSYQYPDDIQIPMEASRYYAIARNRSRVARDEFMTKRLSEAEIANYFRFDPVEKDASLEQMWTCSDHGTPQDGRSKKLVYLHISRVAGMTVRTMLRAYVDYCKAGLALVSHCLDLGVEYMRGKDAWANGKGSRRSGENCFMSYAVNRTGHQIDFAPATTGVSTAFLENNTDILAGKIPLGSDQYWMDSRGEHVDVQYVVFLRDPLPKFVSEVLYANRMRNLTVDDAVELIGTYTTSQRALGRYHEKYSGQLITPEQMNWATTNSVLWSPDRRTNLTLANIADKKILVGITERMPQSVKLLEYVIDMEHEVPALFKFFGTDERLLVRGRLGTKNMTEPVLVQIRKDAIMLGLLKEYLKFEDRIYDYALQLHERQYRWFQNARQRIESTNL